MRRGRRAARAAAARCGCSARGLTRARRVRRHRLRAARRRDPVHHRPRSAPSAPSCCARCSARTASTPARLELDGQPVAFRTPAQAMAAGVGFVPEDRHRDGLMLGLSVAENLVMATLDALHARVGCSIGARMRGGRAALDRRARHPAAGRPARTVRLLSGGNQQKVLVGKWLARAAARPHPRRADGRRRRRRQGRDLRDPARRARPGRRGARGLVRPRGGDDARRPHRRDGVGPAGRACTTRTRRRRRRSCARSGQVPHERRPMRRTRGRGSAPHALPLALAGRRASRSRSRSRPS